jgi:hypothetical protein
MYSRLQSLTSVNIESVLRVLSSGLTHIFLPEYSQTILGLPHRTPPSISKGLDSR